MDDRDEPREAQGLAPQLQLLTQQRVAELLQVDARTVRRWVSQGMLRQVTPTGSRVARYRVADIEALLNDTPN